MWRFLCSKTKKNHGEQAPAVGWRAPGLEPAAEAQDEVEGGLLLDVVVREGAAVLELLARKDEALLVRRDPFLVLDLGLDVLDRVRGLDLERDRLARQRLDKDLHPAAQAQDEVEGGLLLDVVVREGAAVLELLARPM